MTMIDPGLDVIMALDFDFAIPCDNLTHDDVKCDRSAEWKITIGCCGKIVLYCTDHKDYMVEACKRLKDVLHNPEAGGCGHLFKIASVEPL